MRYDELAHYGVKGMRWRFKKGSIIDPKNTSIRVKKPDGTARSETEKNLSLSGTSNKKFNSSERELNDSAAKDELSKKAEAAAKADAEDRQKREDAIRNAYENSLKQAQERAAESSGGGSSKKSSETKEVQKETKVKKTSANNDKFKEINRRDREYTYQQNAINKSQGIDRVNVMNDKTKTDEQFKKKKK